MKNKILALAVAGAALATAAISAPAQAQTPPPTVQVISQPIGLTVTVPEILYLRTVDSLTLSLTPQDLGAASTLNLTESNGIYSGSATRGTTLDTTPPFGGGSTSGLTVSDKTFTNVYAIWSNTPRAAGISATVGIGTPALTSANGGTGQITNPRTAFGANTANSITATAAAPGLAATPAIGKVTLDVVLNGAQTAGNYSGGTITITAAAP